MKLREALPLALIALACAWVLFAAADWLARSTFGLFS
jgi:hypothetical protein